SLSAGVVDGNRSKPLYGLSIPTIYSIVIYQNSLVGSRTCSLGSAWWASVRVVPNGWPLQTSNVPERRASLNKKNNAPIPP
ncbi:MAG TPA: hypothetical protein VMF69_21285, partial [Gemmataceae bacterium]|nr:hypothetical protein [Gemmataceae bacterium]